jgi:hypothetical protein
VCRVRDRPCVKTHTSGKCRKNNSQTRHRASCVQYDLTPRCAISSGCFYVHGRCRSFRTAWTHCSHWPDPDPTDSDRTARPPYECREHPQQAGPTCCWAPTRRSSSSRRVEGHTRGGSVWVQVIRSTPDKRHSAARLALRFGAKTCPEHLQQIHEANSQVWHRDSFWHLRSVYHEHHD